MREALDRQLRADVAPESGVEKPASRRRSRRIGAAIGVMGVVLAVIAGVLGVSVLASVVHPRKEATDAGPDS